MRLTLIDSRHLGVGLCQPEADQWWNWSKSTWETPFNATNHLIPLAPLEAAPSPIDNIVSADLGTAVFADADAAVCIFTLTPLALVDPKTLVYPLSPPGTYGWPT